MTPNAEQSGLNARWGSWGCGVASFLVCLAFVGPAWQGLESADARTPLKGSASFNRQVEDAAIEATNPAQGAEDFSARTYYPASRTVLYADRLTEQYKLKAAESVYRRILRDNPRSPAAWNGLGKIAYYQTTSSNQAIRNQTDALYTQAIQHFMTALRYQPGYAEARANLARIYMEQGRLDEAGVELARAYKLSPQDYRVLARKGEWLVRQQRYNEAVPILQRSIRLNSGDDAAHYYLAVAYAARNQLTEALAQLQSAMALNPDNAPAHFQMALIYEKQGNGAAAVEHYQQALALKPELYKARQKLADYLEEQGDTGLALAHWKRLRSSAQPDWELTQHIAQLSIENNQPEVAVQLYRDWQASHPEDSAKVSTVLSRAKTEVARKKLRDDDLVSQGEAKRYADQAIQYQPNNFEARLISAKLGRQMGESPAANLAGTEPGMVDVALRQASVQPYQAYDKGRILLARFQFEAAEAAFREARRTGEGNRSQLVFGELFLTMGMPDLAAESFHQVLNKLPGHAAAKLGLHKAAEAKNQSMFLLTEARRLAAKTRQEGKTTSRSVAIAQVEQALQLNARNAEAHYYLAQLYEKNEDFAAAADQYYAYVHLEPNGDKAQTAKSKVGDLKEKIARLQSRKP